MIGEQIECENAGCEVTFTKKTHNQRYHDDECCRLATNAKIMQKYYAKRAQRLGLVRHCEACGSKLSRYNSDSTCNACTLKHIDERNNTVFDMVSNSVIA